MEITNNSHSSPGCLLVVCFSCNYSYHISLPLKCKPRIVIESSCGSFFWVDRVLTEDYRLTKLMCKLYLDQDMVLSKHVEM